MVFENPLEGLAMAILDRIRDRNGVSIELGDMADQVRDHAPDTNGIDPAAWASDAANGVSHAANGVSDAAKDAAKDVGDAAKGAMKDASGSVKDASDAARERLEGIGELIRDAIREWSKASGDRKADARLDEIAQRLRSAVPASTFKTTVTRLERELPDTDKDRYDRAYERGRVQARTIYVAGGLAVGIGAGIAAAMLLDPKRGQERRAQIARFKDQVSRQVADRSRELTTRAKAVAAERGIGQPAKPAVTDPVGITTGRDMVPVMPVGGGPVTDPSSIVREPLAGEAGGIEVEPQLAAVPSTVDGTGDRAVTATHS
jgi:gas vesicle protein